MTARPAWCADCHHPMPDTACPRCGGHHATPRHVDRGDPNRGRGHGGELYDGIAWELIVEELTA